MKKAWMSGAFILLCTVLLAGCSSPLGSYNKRSMQTDTLVSRSSTSAPLQGNTWSQTTGETQPSSRTQPVRPETGNTALPQEENDLVECRICEGAGTLGECAVCHGEGYTDFMNSKMKCGYCHGEGKVECWSCKGSGTHEKSFYESQDVPNSAGNAGIQGGYQDGYRHSGENGYRGNESPCPRCHGEKKVVCTSCHGEGYLDQTKYAPGYGQGEKAYTVKIPCATCGHSGKMTCLTCGGSGTV